MAKKIAEENASIGDKKKDKSDGPTKKVASSKKA
jgi:hypothetical protein